MDFYIRYFGFLNIDTNILDYIYGVFDKNINCWFSLHIDLNLFA